MFSLIFTFILAHADYVACEGAHKGFQVTISGKLEDGQIESPMHLQINYPQGGARIDSFDVIEVKFKPKSRLTLKGRSLEGSGKIEVIYGRGRYRGFTKAIILGDDMKIRTTCTVERLNQSGRL